MVNPIKAFSDWQEKQKHAKLQNEIAEERLQMHEDIHQEKEKELEEAQKAKAFAMTEEDKQLLARREARLKEESLQRKIKIENMKSKIKGFANTLSDFSGKVYKLVDGKPTTHKHHRARRSRRKKHKVY